MKPGFSGFFLVFAAICLLSGCIRRGESQPARTAVAEQQTVTVFAAASLANAFREIATVFEGHHPNVEVSLNFAGSQQLARQIALGAPADVFASASLMQMQEVIQSGRVAKDVPLTFARNHLIVVVPRTNPSDIQHLTDLTRTGITLVMADAVVPAGQYTREFLRQASAAFSADFQRQVLANVASYEQNVRAVLTKVSLGEADAGIVYKSDVFHTEAVQSLPIPDSLNATAYYPIAPLADSAVDSLAQAFVDFVHTPAAQAILQEHGFKPPAGHQGPS